MSLHGNLEERQIAESREVVACDLLNILHRYICPPLHYFHLIDLFHSIPIQSIATNGPSLVRCSGSGSNFKLINVVLQVYKVRFVASTLLDAVRKAETAPDSAARADAYLCKDISPSLIR